eukprot:508605-Rhodomonas_salina.4
MPGRLVARHTIVRKGHHQANAPDATREEVRGCRYIDAQRGGCRNQLLAERPDPIVDWFGAAGGRGRKGGMSEESQTRHGFKQGVGGGTCELEACVPA